MDEETVIFIGGYKGAAVGGLPLIENISILLNTSIHRI